MKCPKLIAPRLIMMETLSNNNYRKNYFKANSRKNGVLNHFSSIKYCLRNLSLVTLTMVTGLRGENRDVWPTFELFRGDKIGRGLFPKLILGLDPNPLYLGLKFAAAAGGRRGDERRRFSVSLSPWIRAESLDENPGERTSTRSGDGR